MAYTRAQFRAIIRQRLGWSATDTFVSDAEMNNYLNDSLLELHSLLITTYRAGQWGVVDLGATVLAGQNFFILNLTDFGRLLRVGMPYGGYIYPMEAGDATIDVITTTLATTWTPWNVKYQLRMNGMAAGSELLFTRPTSVDQNLNISFVRVAPVLAADTDTSWMGWDDYAVIDVCIKCRVKEEADVSELESQKSQLQARITAQSTPLDMGRAPTVQDSRSLDHVGNNDGAWWRRWV